MYLNVLFIAPSTSIVIYVHQSKLMCNYFQDTDLSFPPTNAGLVLE